MKDTVTKFGTNNVGETATCKSGMEKRYEKGDNTADFGERKRPRIMNRFSKEQIRTGSEKKKKLNVKAMNETDYSSGRSGHCGRDRQGCERLVSLVPKITSRKKDNLEISSWSCRTEKD